MGFRSTFTTLDYNILWPGWFVEEYDDGITFRADHIGALHSKREGKTYFDWNTLHEDIQRAIDWEKFRVNFILVYLHECGGITRCQIEKDAIKWSEPDTWKITDGVMQISRPHTQIMALERLITDNKITDLR